MYWKRQASGLTEFTPFMCTSAIWGQSCFLVHLVSCIPPAPLNHHGRGGVSIHWIAVWAAFNHIWRPGNTNGCDSVDAIVMITGWKGPCEILHPTLQMPIQVSKAKWLG